MEETSIMFSDDGAVELTTCRILHHSEDRAVQIMLEDFENYEFTSYHIGNYRTILIVFTILTTITLTYNISWYFSGDGFFSKFGVSLWDYIWNGFAMKFCAFFLFLSLLFFIISRRYYVRINGKYNVIEFRIISPKATSIRKFLSSLEAQSNYVRGLKNAHEA